MGMSYITEGFLDSLLSADDRRGGNIRKAIGLEHYGEYVIVYKNLIHSIKAFQKLKFFDGQQLSADNK